MITELYLEWTLFLTNLIMGESKKGLYNNKILYKKEGWLKWKRIELKEQTK